MARPDRAPLPALRAGTAWAACVALGLAVWLAHGDAMDGWFFYDDIWIFKLVWLHQPWEHFIDPRAWRALSMIHFTPWVTLSHGIDFAMFGLDATGFFAHHLIALWLVVVATFVLLSTLCRPVWAWAGTLLFTCSAPVRLVAHQLMTRHYVEGLLFTVLALILWLKAIRDDRPRLAWAAMACMVLAVTCKETYVAALVLLPYLAHVHGCRFSRRLVGAPLILLGAYLAWRGYMLGGLQGGYGTVWHSTATLLIPWRILTALFGSGALGWTAFAVALAGMIQLVIVSRTSRRVIFVGTALLLAPLMVVSDMLTHPGRLHLLPVWALSLGLTIWAARLGSHGIGARLAAVVLLAIPACAGWVAGGRELDERLPEWRRFVIPNRFIVECEPDAVLFTRDATFISWLRREMHHGRGPAMIGDESLLAGIDLTDRRVYRYTDGDAEVREITDEVPALLDDWRSRLRDRPLWIRLATRGDVSSWELGPWPGAYSIVGDTPMARGRRLVPRSGAVRFILAPADLAGFVIRYDSPKGWITYSEPLAYEPRDGNRLEWSR